MTNADPISYLLGELTPGAAADFEAAMERDPELRADVDRLRPVVSGLEALPAEGWDPPEPPPLEPLLPAPERPRRRVLLRPVVAVAAALLLLVIGAAIGTRLDGEDSSPTAGEIALEPVGGRPGGTGSVQVLDDGTRLTLRVEGLQPAGSRFYELWLLGSDDELVSLGSFQVDGDGTTELSLPVPVDPGRFSYFDVSLEPSDGDPGHSGDSVLRGPTGA